MKKNILCLSISFLSILLLSFMLFLYSYKQATPKTSFTIYNNNPKKLVLFIGDGMGDNHIKNTELYFDEKMCFSSFDYKLSVRTHSKTLFGPTDSAAAATALATGKKVYNKQISLSNSSNILSIFEQAKKRGIHTGIITTDNLYGATPAAFSSHAKTRSDTQAIIKGQATSCTDLLVGAGRSTYEKYKDLFIKEGYDFAPDLSTISPNKKTIALFDKISYKESKDAPQTLSSLTKEVISYFEENYRDGYMIMIEGAHIDKMSHQNNLFEMMEYLYDLSRAVSYASSNTDALILVTADHETGGLRLAKSFDELTNRLYTTKSHTNKNVNLYILDKKKVLSKPEFNEIDNTDIYKLCSLYLEIN